MCSIVSRKVPDPRVVKTHLGSKPMDPRRGHSSRDDVLLKAQRRQAPGSARLQSPWKPGEAAQATAAGQTEPARTQVMWDKLVLTLRMTRSEHWEWSARPW